MLRVVELTSMPGQYQGVEDNARFIQGTVVDDGPEYQVMIDVDMGLVYRYFEIIRIL